MKKFLRIAFVLLGIIFVLICAMLLTYYFITYKYKIDFDSLKQNDVKIEYYDSENNLITTESNGKEYTEISKIQPYTKDAFVAIEDKRFWSHSGVDTKSLVRAFMSNLKSNSVKQGGSTITQQLVKNTYLTQEKTLKRKLVEIHLSRQLEETMSKDKILECYLNSIYFGNNCYGITKASRFYFDKSPEQLSVNESAVLAAIINAPSIYNPITRKENCIKRKNLVLGQMKEQGYITNEQYDNSVNEGIELKNTIAQYDYLNLVNEKLNEILDSNPYFKKLKVYTYLDKNCQDILDNSAISSYGEKKLIMNNNGEILAYFSNCANNNRQVGSVIKPILVYAPVLEENVANSCSIINDTKTNFNGYSPKNFNDKYYGKISVKDSLSKSSNVSAVKLLQSVGINNAKKYINKTDIKLNEKDNSLCIALGCTDCGAKFTDISSAYTIFQNDGYFKNAKVIREIKDNSNHTVYKSTPTNNKVFSKDTTYIVNDMLKNVVQNGTARKLKNNLEIYAKTGTVGTAKGNSDAYTISFDKNYIVSCWIGSKDNNLLPNNITGGTTPCIIANNIWNNLYKSKIQNKMYSEVYAKELEIDKNEYLNEKLVLADDLCPKDNKIKELFRLNYQIKEKSNTYSSPKIKEVKTLFENNKISMCLCLPQYIKADVYIIENGKEIYLESISEEKNVIDYNPKQNAEYYFKIMPYFEQDETKTYGQVLFTDKIKTPKSFDFGDDWWIKD